MLFIDNHKQATKRQLLWLHVLPTLLVCLAFLLVTLWSWQTTKMRVEREQQERINQSVGMIKRTISSNFTSYEQALIASAGLFSASDTVTRSEWNEFQSALDTANRYPGVQGIAFIEQVPNSKKQAYIKRIRAEGFKRFTITPPGTRSFYLPITYPTTPLKASLPNGGLSSFGFDVYTTATRRQAIDVARETGKTQLSGKLQLLPNNSLDNLVGFIAYQPAYRRYSNKAPENIVGYTYAPFVASNFFEGIFKDNATFEEIGIRVYDETISDESLLYENAAFAANENQQEINETIQVLGRQWIITFRPSASMLNPSTMQRPINTLIGGIIFSVLIAGLVLSLLMSRTRNLAFTEEQVLQRAKDDLLSIASHQLRTPATGVKQYIGMLREGYAGKLTKPQSALVEEAYASNERQLGIIDEILHVARLDTGRVELTYAKLSIQNLIEDILKEQNTAIKERNLKIYTSFSKKAQFAYGDHQYLYMALGNLVSNAIKYTYEKGKITITVRRQNGGVSIKIADTGVGIEKSDLELLFKKFSRIPNELSRQTAGSGVGLYLAHQIIQLHGGTITVDSKPDEGSTFTVWLPGEKIDV